MKTKKILSLLLAALMLLSLCACAGTAPKETQPTAAPTVAGKT